MKTISALLALLMLILAAGCGGGTPAPTSAPPPDPERATHPAGMDIPAIGLHVDRLSTFGVDNKGDYRCPVDPQVAAWNRTGTVPGEPGLAVVIAQEQGLFKRLGELKPDDPIFIIRMDGSRLTFTGGASSGASAQLQLTACGGGTPVNVYAGLAPAE